MANATCNPWNPTSEEVAAYLAQMRPVIDRFAERDRDRLAHRPAHESVTRR